ncbi:MAG: hypothetical protein ACLP9L_37520 [Thermoguttaceae bacterium]
MDARLIRPALVAALLLVSMGASYRSANFIVETADPQMAACISQAAEQFRHDLAIEWLGQAMPNWAQPCMMTVQVAPNLGAGGATTFVFDQGEVFGWRMTIQGSAERVLDSVLPHEITHMIFASYFRRPLPRWADEGGATSVEHISEKQKHRQMLVQFLRTGRGIAFSQMFAMTEYPQDVMPLYAQGYSLAEYLIYHGGKKKFVAFLADGMRDGQWSAAVARNYNVNDLPALQNAWVAWVAQGFPAPHTESTVLTAAAQPAAVLPAAAVTDARRARPQPNLIYHIHDKGGAEPPPAAAGRQVLARPDGGSLAPPSRETTQNSLPTSPPQTLPAQGWRTAGSAPAENSTAQASEVTTSQVARPPTMEPSRQVILDWQQR